MYNNIYNKLIAQAIPLHVYTQYILINGGRYYVKDTCTGL